MESGPDAQPLQPPLSDCLSDCRRALERGDYGQVLRTLEPLVAAHPPASAAGGEIQMLLATAWMGQGNSARAIACCQLLKRSSNAQMRSQARDLLAVLEAPALERPRAWSITLPELNNTAVLEGRTQPLVSRRRRRRSPPPPPPPPVGPTRPNLGFALLVAVLMLVAVLLGGCVQVRAEVHFAGPGRLELGYGLAAAGSRPTPWQQQFGDYLAGRGLHPPVPPRRGGDGRSSYWRAGVQPAELALEQLRADLVEAARLAGLSLAPPQLRFEERNWLLGVHQALAIELDLTPLAGVKGLDLAVELEPLALRAVQRATPLAAERRAGDRHGVHWPLQPGAPNRLELRCWRWSPLGLGAVAVAFALALALLLQTLRRSIAPPLPELPA